MIKNNGPSVKAIAHVIRKRRKAGKLSQERLAEVAGVTLSSLQSIERGGDAKIKTLWRLLDALGVTWLEFFTEVDALPF